MNKDQFLRYITIDRCLRNYNAHHDIDSLLEAVNRVLVDHDIRPATKSTIQHDLTNLKKRPYEIELEPGRGYGQNKLYRYKDPSFTIANTIYPTHLKDIISEIDEMLEDYNYDQHYAWLKSTVRSLRDKESGGGSLPEAVDFQNYTDKNILSSFNDLLNSILAKQPVLLKYEPFDKQPYEVICHPYLLKQFNNRWFMIGKTEGHEFLSTYPLDRIKGIKAANKEFIPNSEDFVDYFYDVVGVTVNANEQPVNVIIRVNKNAYKYIETKPLHGSQVVVGRNEDSVTIKLYVQLNYELESLLMSYGPNIEVIEPISLRESIKNKVIAMAKSYSIR